MSEKLSKKENIIQMVKFLAFSCSAGVIETVVFTVLSEAFKFGYWLAYLPALILSVLWNFTLNRNFTFKSANNVGVAMLKIFGYYCVFTPLSTWLGDLCTQSGYNKYAVYFVTIVLNLVTEYLFSRFAIYGNSINTRVKKSGKATDEE